METETTTKSRAKSTNIRVDTGVGLFWFMGWLFTIAFAQQNFWEAVLGLFIWPYYLGLVLR